MSAAIDVFVRGNWPRLTRAAGCPELEVRGGSTVAALRASSTRRRVLDQVRRRLCPTAVGRDPLRRRTAPRSSSPCALVDDTWIALPFRLSRSGKRLSSKGLEGVASRAPRRREHARTELPLGDVPIGSRTRLELRAFDSTVRIDQRLQVGRCPVGPARPRSSGFASDARSTLRNRNPGARPTSSSRRDEVARRPGANCTICLRTRCATGLRRTSSADRLTRSV